MLRRSRRAARSALALLIFGAVAWPGSAAAAPKPLPQEWWFKSWGVQSHLWPKSTGEGVTVAVIDTGVQANLPELRGVVLPGTNTETGSGDGRQDRDSFNDPPGHGTGMASLIVAQGRGTGLVGVAPDVKILPIVAQSIPAYAKGIRFAADHGAQVINLSQGLPGPCQTDLQESIAYAIGKDAVVIVAAGNDGNGANSSNAPANCKGVVSVGAVGPHFKPWEKTQRQPYVTVAGPGVNIHLIFKDGELHGGSGTSAAAALVSGAVAIIRAEHPEMKNRELVRQLVASAKDVHTKGKDSRTGYGIIRPYRPLAGKVPKGTANPVFEEFDRWMKTHHPEGTGTAPASATEDDSSSINLVPYAVAVGFALVVCVFAFFFSRRNARRKGPGTPAAMGPVPGAPPGFGQQQPGPPPGQQPAPPYGGQQGRPPAEKQGPPPGGRQGPPPGGQPTGSPPQGGQPGGRPQFQPPPTQTDWQPPGGGAPPQPPQ